MIKEFKFPKSTFRLLCLSALIPFSISSYNFFNYLCFDSTRIDWLITGAIFLIISIVLFNEAFRKIIIDDLSIISKTKLYSRSQKIENITGYTIVKHPSSQANNKNRILYILSKNGRMNFNSDNWGINFDIICHEIDAIVPNLGEGAEKLIIQSSKNRYKKIGYALGTVIIGFGFLMMFIDRPIQRSNLKAFTVILNNILVKPDVEELVAFKFEEFPNLIFAISNNNYSLLDKELLNQQYGREFKIMVKELDLNHSNSKRHKSTEKFKKMIEIYNMENEERIYLDLENINFHRGRWGNKLWFIGIGIMVILYYRFINKGHD